MIKLHKIVLFYMQKNGYSREIIETENMFSIRRLEGIISDFDVGAGWWALGRPAYCLRARNSKLFYCANTLNLWQTYALCERTSNFFKILKSIQN